MFDLAPLFPAVRKIAASNAQGESYLTDLVGVYRRRRLVVETVVLPDTTEIRGINSRTELAEVAALVRQSKNEELMGSGVTIVDSATTYIDQDVEVGVDTVIHPASCSRAARASARPAKSTRASASWTPRWATARS